MLIKKLQSKKIVILGFGKEGIDTYLALRKLFPGKVLAIADKKTIGEFDKKTQSIFKKDKKLKLYLGNNYLAKVGPIRNGVSNGVKDYDLIIKTPGISPRALGGFGTKSPSALTSQTEIFFDNFPGLIIGITGTKGKGTTSSLIYEILKKAGLPVYLGGNIGSPVFQQLLALRLAPTFAPTNVGASAGKQGENFIFIYELSSHQLQGLKKSPHIAVFLNIMPDHLDYYCNFQEYQKAKANITLHQTKNDFLIYNSSDQKVKAIALKSKAQKIPFNLNKKISLLKIIKPKDISLKGDFNLLNIMAAVETAKIFQIKPSIIKQAVKEFKGLLHRLEFAGKHRGIEFYNNSMATIPETTILDLKTFNGKAISLIVGGSDKGSDYTNLAKEILKTSVKNLVVLGQGTGEKILDLIQKTKVARLPREFRVKSMREAVKVCYEKTPKNGVCLLSPGSASFNIFKDYQDRGDQFKKAVRSFASLRMTKLYVKNS